MFGSALAKSTPVVLNVTSNGTRMSTSAGFDRATWNLPLVTGSASLPSEVASIETVAVSSSSMVNVTLVSEVSFDTLMSASPGLPIERRLTFTVSVDSRVLLLRMSSGNVSDVELAGMVTKKLSARSPPPVPKSWPLPRLAVEPAKLMLTRVDVLEAVDRLKVAEASFEVPSIPKSSDVSIVTIAESSSSIRTVAVVSSSTTTPVGAPLMEAGVSVTVSSNSTSEFSAIGTTLTVTDVCPAGIPTLSVLSVRLDTTSVPLKT